MNIRNNCQTTLNINAAEVDLREALEQISHSMGDDPLVRLLVDLREAGQLESFKQQNGEERTTFWRAASRNDFATRFFAIDNDIQSAVAEGFLAQFVVFSISPGPPIDILWRLAEAPPAN